MACVRISALQPLNSSAGCSCRPSRGNVWWWLNGNYQRQFRDKARCCSIVHLLLPHLVPKKQRLTYERSRVHGVMIPLYVRRWRTLLLIEQQVGKLMSSSESSARRLQPISGNGIAWSRSSALMLSTSQGR
jgi:hypothetical protein